MPPAPKPAGDVTTKSPWNDVSMMWLNDAFADAAKIVMNATRPTPIINADAVAAVRLGLRIAFSRASCPQIPRSRGSGQPMNRLSGSATVRPRTATPKNTSSTATPTTGNALLGVAINPYARETKPSPRITHPTMIRCIEP